MFFFSLWKFNICEYELQSNEVNCSRSQTKLVAKTKSDPVFSTSIPNSSHCMMLTPISWIEHMDQIFGAVWSLVAHATLESITLYSFRIVESIY